MAKKETKTNRFEQIRDDEKNKKTISIKYVGLLKNKWCFVDGNGKESKIPKYKDDDSVLSALPVKMITVTHKRVPDSQAGILSQLNGLTVEEAECFFTKLMTITGYAAQLKQTFILKASPQELEERLNKILDSDYVKGMVYYMPEEEIPYALSFIMRKAITNKHEYEYFQQNQELYLTFFKKLEEKIKQARLEADPNIKNYYEEPAKRAFKFSKKKEFAYGGMKLVPGLGTSSQQEDAPQPQ